MDGHENRRVAMTKRLVQEGLLRLLDKKELAKISVTELCREADVNRATFYRYYGSPADVLSAIKKQFFQDLLESQEKTDAKAPATYLEVMERMCEYLHENRELAKHIIRNMDFDIPYVVIQMSHGQNGTYDYLTTHFDDKDSVKLADTFICYGGYSVIRQWLTEDMEKTPQEIAGILCRLMNSDIFQ